MKRKLAAAAVAITALMSACKDKVTPKQYAMVNFVHASPDAPGFNVQRDSNIIGPYVLQFAQSTGYQKIEAGNANFLFTTYRLDSADTVAYRTSVNLKENEHFTVVLIDSFHKIASLTLNDDINNLSADKAHVRFVHLGPDAGRVSLVHTQDSAVIFGNMGFKDATSYTDFKPGVYDWDLRIARTDTVVKVIPTNNFSAGKAYSIYLIGFARGMKAAEMRTITVIDKE